jgi:hypothetical protein
MALISTAIRLVGGLIFGQHRQMRPSASKCSSVEKFLRG